MLNYKGKIVTNKLKRMKMKKQIMMVCIIAAALLALPQTTNAQGLLKKINKGLEKVNKALDNTNNKVDVATGQAVELEGGGVMYNGAAKWMDVQLVGVYGTTTSTNYGYVDVVLKVNMKLNKSQVWLGGKVGQNTTMATDGDGNVYKMKSPSLFNTFDVEEGVFVKVTLSEDAAFQDVRKSATEFQVLKIWSQADYDGHNGMITFKNVPIQWDVEH